MYNEQVQSKYWVRPFGELWGTLPENVAAIFMILVSRYASVVYGLVVRLFYFDLLPFQSNLSGSMAQYARETTSQKKNKIQRN